MTTELTEQERINLGMEPGTLSVDDQAALYAPHVAGMDAGLRDVVEQHLGVRFTINDDGKVSWGIL